MIFLFASGIGIITSLINSEFFSLSENFKTGFKLSAGILLLYFILNLFYSLYAKHFPLIDVFIIATGFVLRLYVGAFVSDVSLSQWIVLMTFLLALFLSIAKRRDDVINYQTNKVVLRKNIHKYNLEFMNQAISVIGSITVVCYIMYTMSEEVQARLSTSNLYLTSIFVLAGIIRYLQITVVDAQSGNPTKILLKDRFIQTMIIFWTLSFLIILYA